MRIASLSLLALCLAVVPAMARLFMTTVRSTATPMLGQLTSVSSLAIPSHSAAAATVSGLSFGTWMFEGDVLQTADSLDHVG